MFVLCLIVQKGELSKHGMRLSKTHPSMNECKSKKGLTGRKEQLAMFLKVQHPTLIQKVAKNCYNGRYQHNLHFGAYVCELYRV